MIDLENTKASIETALERILDGHVEPGFDALQESRQIDGAVEALCRELEALRRDKATESIVDQMAEIVTERDELRRENDRLRRERDEYIGKWEAAEANWSNEVDELGARCDGLRSERDELRRENERLRQQTGGMPDPYYETQPGSPNFEGGAAWERYLDEQPRD